MSGVIEVITSNLKVNDGYSSYVLNVKSHDEFDNLAEARQIIDSEVGRTPKEHAVLDVDITVQHVGNKEKFNEFTDYVMLELAKFKNPGELNVHYINWNKKASDPIPIPGKQPTESKINS
jgi:hypothetical protein